MKHSENKVKQCRQAKYRNAFLDYKNQNVEQIWKCISIMFCNSEKNVNDINAFDYNIQKHALIISTTYQTHCSIKYHV